MKKLVCILMITILFSGCKKTIENIQEDLVLKAMIDGQWRVTNFINNGTTITSDFSTYKFQYYNNKTVDAIKNGIVEITGTWDGNATAMTTFANFTTTAYPIQLINGTWNITKNSWTYVEATQNIGSNTKFLRLDKL
ncbi:MAG: hypothetical protein ABIP79_04435 [Chitinophagaceae bacterium]